MWSLLQFATPVILWVIETFVINRQQKREAKKKFLKMVSAKKDFGKRGARLREEYREIFEEIDRERQINESNRAEN